MSITAKLINLGIKMSGLKKKYDLPEAQFLADCSSQQKLDTKPQNLCLKNVSLYKPCATIDITPRIAGQCGPQRWTHEQIVAGNHFVNLL